LMVTGTAEPLATPVGTTAFTCITPATNPDAPPAYCTTAGTPPISTVTGRTGFGAALPANTPSWPGGLV
jgi:hypothetical protein